MRKLFQEIIDFTYYRAASNAIQRRPENATVGIGGAVNIMLVALCAIVLAGCAIKGTSPLVSLVMLLPIGIALLYSLGEVYFYNLSQRVTRNRSKIPDFFLIRMLVGRDCFEKAKTREHEPEDGLVLPYNARSHSGREPFSYEKIQNNRNITPNWGKLEDGTQKFYSAYNIALIVSAVPIVLGMFIKAFPTTAFYIVAGALLITALVFAYKGFIKVLTMIFDVKYDLKDHKKDPNAHTGEEQ